MSIFDTSQIYEKVDAFNEKIGAFASRMDKVDTVASPM